VRASGQCGASTACVWGEGEGGPEIETERVSKHTQTEARTDKMSVRRRRASEFPRLVNSFRGESTQYIRYIYIYRSLTF